MASRTFMSSAVFRSATLAGSEAILARRGITSTAVLRHKEDSIHHDHENPDNQQRHRDDLLAKQKRGQGHWKPELASNSEEAVKADRAHRDGGGAEDIRTLQDRTKSLPEETKKHSTSMRDGL